MMRALLSDERIRFVFSFGVLCLMMRKDNYYATLSAVYEFIGGKFMMSQVFAAPIQNMIGKIGLIFPNEHDVTFKNMRHTTKKQREKYDSLCTDIDKKRFCEACVITRELVEKPAATLNRQKCDAVFDFIGQYENNQIIMDSVKPFLYNILTGNKLTFRPLLLLGPSGTGKTFLVQNIADITGIEVVHFNMKTNGFRMYEIQHLHPDVSIKNNCYEMTQACLRASKRQFIFFFDEIDCIFLDDKSDTAYCLIHLILEMFSNYSVVHDRMLVWDIDMSQILYVVACNKDPSEINLSSSSNYKLKIMVDRFARAVISSMSKDVMRRIVLKNVPDVDVEVLDEALLRYKEPGVKQLLSEMNDATNKKKITQFFSAPEPTPTGATPQTCS